MFLLCYNEHGQVDKCVGLVTPGQAAHHCVGSSSPVRDSADTCEKQPHQSAPKLIKWLECVPSCLCDWCTLKNMCGPWQYAKPSYCYLSDISVWVCEMIKCVALKADRGRHCPIWDCRPVCSQESWFGRRSLLLNIKEWKEKSWALARMNWPL